MLSRKDKVALLKLNPARILTKSTSRVLRDFRLFHRGRPGAPPGTIHVDPEAQKPQIKLIQYDAEVIEEHDIASPSEIPAVLKRGLVNWISVQGLGDEQTLLALRDQFKLHRLAMEDVVHVHQRAKVEKYGDDVFIVMPAPLEGDCFATEQISIFLCRDIIVTFEEWTNPALDPIRERLRRAQGIVRQRKEDYLAYALLDTAIDNYFPALEQRAEKSEELELELLAGRGQRAMAKIHGMKQDLLLMRRTIWPMRDMTAALQRDFPDHFSPETLPYLRDCQDHVNQLLDHLDTYREMITNLRELHLANQQQRNNEVVKTLTICGTIFFPLNLIAAIYGMNFETEHPLNMPELSWPYGYLFSLGLMAAVAAFLLAYFHHRGWIGRGD